MSKWLQSGGQPPYSSEEVLVPGILFDQSSRFGIGTSLLRISVAKVETTWGFTRSGFYKKETFKKISEFQPPVFLLPKGYILFPVKEEMDACLKAHPNAVFASEI